MADSAVPITAGSGTNVDTYQLGVGGDHQQVVREAPASAIGAPTTWTLATTGAASVIAADVSRRAIVFWNRSQSATVYLRYDGTAPTTTTWHDQIPPNSRLVVEKELATLAISLVASATDASNNLVYGLATTA